MNNPEEGDMARLLDLKVPYIVVGREEGSLGTEHLQGYMEAHKALRFNAAKAMIGARAHLEPRRGTPQQAADYCKKDGDFEERGTLSSTRRGYRTDLDAVRRAVAEDGMRGIVGYATAQQQRAAMAYLAYCEDERDFKPEVTWIWGPTGSGKTRRVREECPEDLYIKGSTKWWDGYDKHEYVLLDDFRRGQILFPDLLRLLDRYPYRCEVKGGFRQMLAKRIYITAPVGPREMYAGCEEDIEQLIRRIDNIIHLQ